MILKPGMTVSFLNLQVDLRETMRILKINRGFISGLMVAGCRRGEFNDRYTVEELNYPGRMSRLVLCPKEEP